jgi:hypothetical protein
VKFIQKRKARRLRLPPMAAALVDLPKLEALYAKVAEIEDERDIAAAHLRRIEWNLKLARHAAMKMRFSKPLLDARHPFTVVKTCYPLSALDRCLFYMASP